MFMLNLFHIFFGRYRCDVIFYSSTLLCLYPSISLFSGLPLSYPLRFFVFSVLHIPFPFTYPLLHTHSR